MMNNTPLVSVIIPTYNRKNLVIRSIQSALYQTYDNIEVIVIDDGSSDGTFEHLTQFYRDNGNVKCLKNEINSGPVFSRNRAINFSKGDFIAFLDSDDRWIDCEKISRDVSFLWEEYSIVHSKALVLKKNNKIKTINSLFYSSLLIRPLHFSTVTISRKIIDESALFNIYWEWAEDFEFILRIARKCNIKYLEYYTTLWEVTHNSFSDKVRVCSNIKCLKLIFQYRKDYPLFFVWVLYHLYLLINSIRKKYLIFIIRFFHF